VDYDQVDKAGAYTGIERGRAIVTFYNLGILGAVKRVVITQTIPVQTKKGDERLRSRPAAPRRSPPGQLSAGRHAERARGCSLRMTLGGHRGRVAAASVRWWSSRRSSLVE